MINTHHIIFSHRLLPCMNSTILIGSEFNLRYCGVCGYGIKISLMFVKRVLLLKCIFAMYTKGHHFILPVCKYIINM